MLLLLLLLLAASGGAVVIRLGMSAAGVVEMILLGEEIGVEHRRVEN
jgi:hypothetical protein